MAVHECPLCHKYIESMSQHLRVFHGIINKTERSLLLKLVSGRVDVRLGICPVPGCGQNSSRLDRHLNTHHELNKTQKGQMLDTLRKKVIISKLTELRESDPDVPMQSNLDLEELERQEELEATRLGAASEDPILPMEEEGEACENEACMRKAELLKRQDSEIGLLNEEREELKKELHLLRRQNRLLQRRLNKMTIAALKKKARPPSPKQRDPEASTSQDAPMIPAYSEPPPYPEHVPQLNELLHEFQKHQEGPDPSARLKNNVQSKVYRIKRFLAFMAVGQTHLATLAFLNSPTRIREWVNSLMSQKVVASTLGHYLKNVAQFMGYIAETPPATSRLTKAALVGITRELRGIIKKQRRTVVVRQIKVKELKDSRAIPKAVLQKCKSRASEAIPKILEQLTKHGSPKIQWSFYGHLTAYLACIYGHRTGVFQNLTVEEVTRARHDAEQHIYLVNVEGHKTNQAFGVAQLLLTKDEYQWFTAFLDLKDTLPGGRTAKFFFFTSSQNQCKNLNHHLQTAWKQMRLPGRPKFTDIRTAIATYARNDLGPDDHGKQILCIEFEPCRGTGTQGSLRRPPEGWGYEGGGAGTKGTEKERWKFTKGWKKN